MPIIWKNINGISRSVLVDDNMKPIPWDKRGELTMAESNKSGDKVDKELILKCMRDKIDQNNKDILKLHEQIEGIEKDNKKIKDEIEKMTHDG